jgi:tRNA U38,U39,U40 pseudouridine synthase TruA
LKSSPDYCHVANRHTEIEVVFGGRKDAGVHAIRAVTVFTRPVLALEQFLEQSVGFLNQQVNPLRVRQFRVAHFNSPFQV